MQSFEYEFEGLVPEFGVAVIVAETREIADAEFNAYIDSHYPEMSDVKIVRVRDDD